MFSLNFYFDQFRNIVLTIENQNEMNNEPDNDLT